LDEAAKRTEASAEPLSHKPDYLERGLRARHKRPRNDRTTHKAEKFPSPHRHAPDNRPTQTITSEV